MQNNRTKQLIQIVIVTVKIVSIILIAFAMFTFCTWEYEFHQVFGHWGEFYKLMMTCIGIFLILFLVIFRIFDARWRSGIIWSIIVMWFICLIVIEVQYACC